MMTLKKYLLLAGLTGLCSCTPNEKVISFRGIAVDDVNGTAGLYNPERGFRLETAVDVAMQKSDPTLQLDTLSQKYASDSVALSQSYFYLTFLTDKTLGEDDFATMQTYFDRMRLLGKKAVLRFAYEKDFMGRAPIGPTLEQALAHLDQLKPFLHENKDLILVVQAGVIGAWGEWHSSVHGLENSEEAKKAILEKLLEVVPEDKDVQVRVPDYKNLLKERPELYRRLSFHDDFIVIRPDRWDGDMHEGTANFDQIVKESPHLAVDGELPWGFWSVGADPDSPSAGWVIDGMQAARRLFLQHFTSLSVIHNYKEQHPNRTFDEANAPEYSMVVWKKTLITPDSLKKYHMPVSDGYFRKKDGTEVARSVFDYVRDHLGYRIELQQLELPQEFKSGEDIKLNVDFINRGFAGFNSKRPAYFVLVDENGQTIELQAVLSSEDCQPYEPGDSSYTPLLHSISYQGRLNAEPGTYRLGLWLPDESYRLKCDPHYAIRCANGGLDWWTSQDGLYGVNLLTEIQINE